MGVSVDPFGPLTSLAGAGGAAIAEPPASDDELTPLRQLAQSPPPASLASRFLTGAKNYAAGAIQGAGQSLGELPHMASQLVSSLSEPTWDAERPQTEYAKQHGVTIAAPTSVTAPVASAINRVGDPFAAAVEKYPNQAAAAVAPTEAEASQLSPTTRNVTSVGGQLTGQLLGGAALGKLLPFHGADAPEVAEGVERPFPTTESATAEAQVARDLARESATQAARRGVPAPTEAQYAPRPVTRVTPEDVAARDQLGSLRPPPFPNAADIARQRAGMTGEALPSPAAEAEPPSPTFREGRAGAAMHGGLLDASGEPLATTLPEKSATPLTIAKGAQSGLVDEQGNPIQSAKPPRARRAATNGTAPAPQIITPETYGTRTQVTSVDADPLAALKELAANPPTQSAPPSPHEPLENLIRTSPTARESEPIATTAPAKAQTDAEWLADSDNPTKSNGAPKASVTNRAPPISTAGIAGREKISAHDKGYLQMGTDQLLDELHGEHQNIDRLNTNTPPPVWARETDVGEMVSGGRLDYAINRQQAAYAAQRVTAIERELQRRGVPIDEMQSGLELRRERALERPLDEDEEADLDVSFPSAAGSAAHPAEAPRSERAGTMAVPSSRDIGASPEPTPVSGNDRPYSVLVPRAVLDPNDVELGPLVEGAGGSRVRADIPGDALGPEGLRPLEGRAAREGTGPLASSASVPSARIGLSAEQGAQLDKVTSDLIARGFKKQYRSFPEQLADARQFAQSFGQDPTQVDVTKLQHLSGTQIQGLRILLAQHLSEMSDLEKSFADPSMTMEKAEQVAARLEQVRQSAADHLQTIVKESGDRGRDLGILRAQAASSLDRDLWAQRAQRAAGRTLTAEEIAEVNGLVDAARTACGVGA